MALDMPSYLMGAIKGANSAGVKYVVVQELPTTGEDQNQWGRDWNDDSVHSEEPFGSKIGDGDPFTQLVNAVTKDVMYQLKKGIPIEGENKKKED